jgi:preprotein translocase subunit SecE
MAVTKQQLKARKPVASPGDNAPAPLARGRGFLHEVWVELKKTTWPTPKEAWRLTSVVLGVIIIVAIYIGAIDWILTWLTAKFHLIK